MEVHNLDKKILDIIQTDFPLVPEPYKELAYRLNTSEELIIERIKHLQQSKIIRRLGGIFDSRQVGYTGTLIAMKVPGHKINNVTRVINEYSGVTHNYLRDHEYNMWFTLLAESQEKIKQTIKQIQVETGITQILNLPASKIFKIKVNFNLQGEENAKRERETNN
ncbi:MAG: AsnC family transcriptional regulator [Clostridiales bacterium]|nr:AsnC family transcriptional regulator [Clostridiales bacterium]MCF8021932.1 AsnC family transcriptional regulator [Clostridiales bacterium]